MLGVGRPFQCLVKKHTVVCGGAFIKFRGWVGVLEKKLSTSTEFWWGMASDHKICTFGAPCLKSAA